MYFQVRKKMGSSERHSYIFGMQDTEADAVTLTAGTPEQAVCVVFACCAVDHDERNQPKAERAEGCSSMGDCGVIRALRSRLLWRQIRHDPLRQG